VATGVFRKPYTPDSRRPRPGNHSAPLQRLPQPFTASGRTATRCWREPLRLRHRVRGVGVTRGHSLRHRHRAASVAGREPSGTHRFPRARLRRHAHPQRKHTSRQKDAPHIRHGGGPLLRYRKKDLLAAGVDASSGTPSVSKVAYRCSATGRVLACGTSSGAPVSGPTSAGSASRSSSATTGIRCNTEERLRRHPASTSWVCRFCTRSRPCSLPAAGGTPNTSRARSCATAHRPQRKDRRGRGAGDIVSEEPCLERQSGRPCSARSGICPSEQAIPTRSRPPTRMIKPNHDVGSPALAGLPLAGL